MGLPRSAFYDVPAIVVAITAICDDFESYGYRPVGAALRHQGFVVKGVRPLRSEPSLFSSRREAAA